MHLYDNRGPANPSEFNNPLPEPMEPTVGQYGSAVGAPLKILICHVNWKLKNGKDLVSI